MQNIDTKFDVRLDGFNLEDIDDTIHVLDNQVHSMFLQNIKKIPEFDDNDKRWELFQSPEAWKFVTEDYQGFWNWIRETKNYKAFIFMPDAQNIAGTEHITAIIDNNREFLQDKTNTFALNHHANTQGEYAQRNELSQHSKVVFFYLYDTTNNYYYLWLYKYNPDTTLIEKYEIPWNTRTDALYILPVNQQFFKCPWLWACTAFGILTDDDDQLIRWPTDAQSSVSGYVSERENFCMSVSNSVNKIYYGIDDKKHTVLQYASAGDERGFPIFTNAKETHFVMGHSVSKYSVVNRAQINAGITTLNPITPNVSLQLPGQATKCTLSPDGTMLAWTDRVQGTPRLRIMRLRDGQIIYTSSLNAACCNAIWTDSNVIFVNSIANVLSRYVVAGSAEQLFVQEISNYLVLPAGDYYTAHYLEGIKKILYIKGTTNNTKPVCIVVDESTGRLDYQSQNSNYIAPLTNFNANSRIIRVPFHDDWFIIPTTNQNVTILLKFNKASQLWSEQILTGASQGVAQDQYQYYPCLFFDRGNICVFYNIARGTSGVVIPIYNLKDGTIIDTLPSQGWATLRKEDETHFIHNGASYTALYEIDLQNYVIKEKLRQTGAGRSICYGFNDK